jgi:Kdo2-lipid IVA lauroyltransferase/acyltransferase
MSRILFYLVLKPVSMLPFGVIYCISDFLYLLLYRVLGFRKGVVRGNIARSFPEKSAGERLRIERAFYGHFMDLLMESIKLFSVRREELLARCVVLNPEVFQPYIETGRRIIIASGHFANWELAAQAFSLQVPMRVRGIYSPLKDAFMDRELGLSRGKFGMELVSRKVVARAFEEPAASAEAFLFATDQAPSNVYKAYWTIFLHQETPVFFGAEKYATEYDCPVFFTQYRKPRRGHYEITFTLLEPEPARTDYGDITLRHTRALERDIREQPHLWLWSHRRWKRVRPQEVPLHQGPGAAV